MTRIMLVFVLLLHLLGAFLVEGWRPSTPSVPCSPPPGYLPRPCKIIREISSLVQRQPPFIYGVNVCRVQKSQLVTVYNYYWQRRCGWRYHYYHYWACYQECVPASTCSNATRIHTSTTFGCCPGFIPRPPVKRSWQYQFYSRYFIPEVTQPSGCPLARAPTLYQCLIIHNLTSFVSLIDLANRTSELNSTDAEFTIFGPPNAAVDRLNIMDKEAAEHFLANHILSEDRKSETLTHNLILQSDNGTTLYVTVVDHYYYIPLIYSHSQRYTHGADPYYYNYYNTHRSQYILLGTDRYITGSHIINPDSCSIRKGSLHLLDKPIPYSPFKLSYHLQASSNYSRFKTAMDAVGVTSFLDSSPSAHTVLAPVDSAFDVWPPRLWECLIYFDRRPLNSIVLYHIATGAEYSSSLLQRNWLATRLSQHIQLLNTVDQVLLTTERVPILYPDQPASDGVIHGIRSILMPDNVNFGQCQPFATLTPTPSPSVSSTYNSTMTSTYNSTMTSTYNSTMTSTYNSTVTPTHNSTVTRTHNSTMTSTPAPNNIDIFTPFPTVSISPSPSTTSNEGKGPN